MSDIIARIVGVLPDWLLAVAYVAHFMALTVVCALALWFVLIGIADTLDRIRQSASELKGGSGEEESQG